MVRYFFRYINYLLRSLFVTSVVCYINLLLHWFLVTLLYRHTDSWLHWLQFESWLDERAQLQQKIVQLQVTNEKLETEKNDLTASYQAQIDDLKLRVSCSIDGFYISIMFHRLDFQI